MIGLLMKLLRYLPGLSAILDKITGDASKAQEIRAQTEQDDIRGFHRTGRISASHLWRYVKVLIALLLACAFIAMIFFPETGSNAISLLDNFAKAIAKLFALEM